MKRLTEIEKIKKKEEEFKKKYDELAEENTVIKKILPYNDTLSSDFEMKDIITALNELKKTKKQEEITRDELIDEIEEVEKERQKFEKIHYGKRTKLEKKLNAKGFYFNNHQILVSKKTLYIANERDEIITEIELKKEKWWTSKTLLKDIVEYTQDSFEKGEKIKLIKELSRDIQSNKYYFLSEKNKEEKKEVNYGREGIYKALETEEAFNQNIDIYKEHLFLGFKMLVDNTPSNVMIWDTGDIKVSQEKEIEAYDNKIIKLKKDLILEENQIDIEGIKLLHNYIDNNKKVDTIDLYNEIKQLIKGYVDFISEEEYDIITSWVFQTYYFNLIGTTTYLHVLGNPGCGKSQLMKLLSKISNKANYTVHPSMASLYRRIDSSQNALFVDEFDKYNKEAKQEVMGIINNGITTGGRVERIGGQNNDEVYAFNVFSPKLFAGNFDEFVSSFKSRTIDITMIRTMKVVKDIDYPPTEDKKRFKEIRNKLYVWILTNWKEIVNTFENMERIKSSREEQVTKPLYPILKLIGKDKEIGEFIKKQFISRQIEEESNDIQYYLLQAIYESFSKEEKVVEIPVKELTGRWNELMNSPADKQKTSKTCGRYLKLLGLSNNKIRQRDGYKYIFFREMVERIIQSKNYTSIIGEKVDEKTKENIPITQNSDEEKIYFEDLGTIE